MQRWRKWIAGTLVLAGLVGLWALAVAMGHWPKQLFPSPMAVAERLGVLASDGVLWKAALQSLGRLGRGYFISAAIGIPLGLAMGRLPVLRSACRPLVVGLQALPSICWLPLALLWFGLTDTAIVFVVVMGSALAIAIATEDAVMSIEPNLLRVASTFGIRGLRYQLGVVVPAALPGIVTGLKLGWSFAWRALMAGELLYMSGGLGQLLTAGRELLESSQVVAVMLVIVLIGVVIDRLLFRSVEGAVRRRWGLTAG